MKKIFMALAFFSLVANAKIPKWASSDTTKLNGSALTTVCHGLGPSVEIARSEALASCQINASQFFKSKVSIKTLSVETEKSVGLHQEISSNDEISNLICEPIKDEIEELDSQYSIWMMCKFNVSKTKSSSIEAPKTIEATENNNLSPVKPNNKPSNNLIKTIILSTVPKCDSIIIKGDRSRTIDCKSNPMELDITDSDNEAIIRVRYYKPKTIQLMKRTDNETIQILFEK